MRNFARLRPASASSPEWHEKHFGTGVRIIYLTPGGTLDIVRYVADSYARLRSRTGLADEALVTPVAELVWGGGDTTFERELKPFLKPVTLPKALQRLKKADDQIRDAIGEDIEPRLRELLSGAKR